MKILSLPTPDALTSLFTGYKLKCAISSRTGINVNCLWKWWHWVVGIDIWYTPHLEYSVYLFGGVYIYKMIDSIIWWTIDRVVLRSSHRTSVVGRGMKTPSRYKSSWMTTNFIAGQIASLVKGFVMHCINRGSSQSHTSTATKCRYVIK